jgi:hypothetical protein
VKGYTISPAHEELLTNPERVILPIMKASDLSNVANVRHYSSGFSIHLIMTSLTADPRPVAGGRRGGEGLAEPEVERCEDFDGCGVEAASSDHLCVHAESEDSRLGRLVLSRNTRHGRGALRLDSQTQDILRRRVSTILLLFSSAISFSTFSFLFI